VEQSEEQMTMRIEGTYTLPGTSDHVFAALTSAEQLGRALPDCERLIQLGPASPDGAVSFQARLRAMPGSGPVTATVTAVAARRPAHLRLKLHGRTQSGPITGSGVVDLVEQEDYTILAYVWDVEVGDIAAERQRAMRDAAHQYIRVVCERLGSALRTDAEREPRAAASVAAMREGEMLEVTTPRGKIVKLPATTSAPPLSAAGSAWVQRAAWMTTGMLIGVTTIGLLMGLGRWFNDHER
jgi:carbon monoxide dehydrogenase subunit G